MNHSVEDLSIDTMGVGKSAKKLVKAVAAEAIKSTCKAMENPIVRTVAAPVMAPVTLAAATHVLSKSMKGEDPFGDLKDILAEDD